MYLFLGHRYLQDQLEGKSGALVSAAGTRLQVACKHSSMSEIPRVFGGFASHRHVSYRQCMCVRT